MTNEIEDVDAVVSDAEMEIAEEIAAETEPSIWGQPSDVDFLAPATRVGEYEEMLNDDGLDVGADISADNYEEDVSDLKLE